MKTPAASGTRRRLLTLTALAVALLAPVSAQAYWTSSGSGSGSGNAGTLAAPTNVIGTPGAGTVALSWNAVPPPGSGAVSYYVRRDGVAVSGCQALAGTTCLDSGRSAGTYSYTVTAVWRSWTATSSTIQVNVTIGAAAKLSFTQSPGNTAAGVAFTLQPKVTVQDQSGNTVTTDTSSVNLAITTPAGATLTCTANPKAASAGVATFAGCKIDKAGTYTLTATDGSLTSAVSSSFTISAGAASKLSFTTQPGGGTSSTAWAAQPVVTVQDATGNTVTTDTSSVTLAITTPAGATLTCTANPKAASAGVATFAGCKIDKAGTYTLTATDGSLTSAVSSSFTISAGAASKLSFTQSPGNTTAGAAFTLQPQVTVQDQYGNTVTTDTSSVNLAITTPAGATLTCTANPKAASSGVATFAGCKIDKAGTYTLTATDGSLTSAATGSFTIGPAAAASYSLTDTSGNPLGAQTAGTAFSVKLTALDAYGNTATGYSTSKTIAWSGPGNAPNSNPPSYPSTATSVTFTNGVGTATGIMLYKAETPTLQAQDSNATTIKGTASFTVNPLAASSLSLSAATTNPTAGVADNLTITAKDVYGNTATSYNTTLGLTFSGASTIGTFHPTVTNSTGTAVNFGTATALSFVNGVASVTGSNNGAMTLYTVETANVSATGGGFTTNTLQFNVGQGPFASFTVANPGTHTAGSSFNLAISNGLDAYGNAFTGTRCFTFTGANPSPNNVAPVYPSQGACPAGQSEVTFTSGSASPSITLYNAASTTLTVTDVATGTARAVGPFTVNAGPRGGYNLVPATTTPTAGAADNLTIYDADAYGNRVAGYNGTRNLYFSGSGSIGTYDPTVTRYNTPTTAIDFNHSTTINFANGVATVASGRNGVMTLYRAGTAHIVVSDGTYKNGSGVEITVNPATMSGIALSAEKVVVRPGATDNLTIRAVDTYGNLAPGYSDGQHSLTFSGGTGARTVTNSSGTPVNFTTATLITFTNGISTAGGVLRINTTQTANITVGDGTHTSASLRIVVSSVAALAVSAGGFHTCALRSDNTVECWGYNKGADGQGGGQLGNGTTNNSSNPVLVGGGLANVTEISAGKYHTCALRSSDGTVWCWGSNDYGQLGDGSGTDRSSPVQVKGVGGTGNLTSVIDIDADGNFTCALLSSGAVRCWGRNQSGQLGIGTADNNSHRTPTAVVGVGGTGTLGSVAHITAGANHACALLSSGGVDCWGLNDHGQLGDGSTTDRSAPVQVRGVGGIGYLDGVTQVSGGRMHVCVLRSDSTVYCWGRNETGELGDGTMISKSVPVRSGDIDTATQVSAGEYHSCARLQDGTAQCWGAAAFGQVGDGTTADTSTPATVIGPGGFGVLSGVAAISAGGGDVSETNDWEHSCALTTDQTVVCWGQNNYGQLGDGTTTMSISPVGVALL